ncbi:hypothetical protein EW146_g451 [Bondarzewia mesenterica]|uniref:Dol-P-Glc:Glc(2)Man(9)GlcNAc(2)-PP-Dol alpha-1,2-glucosyltransferase n=1 Tax=Bondarzewia mesenterica TaxID=1095465 RepID=A0A4S4M756_9AGAM|nr:hypothetical protein EW146_g451 [Bondarzewia mesenterica]
MATVAVETITQSLPALALHPSSDDSKQAQSQTSSPSQGQSPYRYAHLLPHFSPDKYPPLEPYEHVDPGFRALSHQNPRSFLKGASTVIELTPNLGSEVHGISLAQLDSDARDQLALLVAQRGLVVFRDQQEFIDKGPDFYLEWGRHFGREANTTFNFERDDSITSTLWHSDVSYELQPPGLTTFFLLSQPSTGGDTLFISQVSALKKLSPQLVAFLRTLKAIHSGIEQANFSRAGRRGGVVRRDPVEHAHPIIRRHPVTGEEALYINRQFTRRIVGLKREESENLLEFLFSHIDKAGDLQARLKWSPNTVALWDNRVTAHSAIVDYGESKERRHGARITPQAERPIPALEGLNLDDYFSLTVALYFYYKAGFECSPFKPEVCLPHPLARQPWLLTVALVQDEPFHVPQAQRYCDGDWTYWDPKITTPPGLYVLSVLLQKIFLFKCNLAVLRLTPLLTLLLLPIALTRLFCHHKRVRPPSSIFAPTLDAVVVSAFPIAWFFGFLYYTELPSLVSVVMTVVAATQDRHWLAALLGAVSCTFRQTNIVWLLYAYASSQLMYLRWRPAGKGSARTAKLHDPPALLAAPADLFRSLMSAPRVLPDVLPAFVPYALVCVAFGVFVVWNGGIVLGDKSNHIPSFHLPQLYYFVAFATMLGWPVLISGNGGAAKLLHDVWSRMFYGRRRIAITFLVSALMAATIRLFTIHHPFLLSDNRHYTFYVWRRIFMLHPIVPYLFIPGYMACAWAWFLRAGREQSLLQTLLLPVCTLPILLPTPLLEPRYFLIPYILMRAQIVDMPTWGLFAEVGWSSGRYSINLSSVGKALADVINKDGRDTAGDKAPKKSKDASHRRLSGIPESGNASRRTSMGERPGVISPNATVTRTTRRQSTILQAAEAAALPDSAAKPSSFNSPSASAPSSRRSTLRPRSTLAPTNGSTLPKYRPRSVAVEPAKPSSPPRAGTRRRLSSSDEEADEKPAGKRTPLLKMSSPKEKAEKAARAISPLPQRASKANAAISLSSTPVSKAKASSRNTPSPISPVKAGKSGKTMSPLASSVPRPSSSSSSSSSLRTPRTPQTPTSIRDAKTKVLPSGKDGSPLGDLVGKDTGSLNKYVKKGSAHGGLKGDSGSGTAASVSLFTEGSSTDSMEAVELMLSPIVSSSGPTPPLPHIRMGRAPSGEPVTPSRAPGAPPTRSNLSYLSPLPPHGHSPSLRPMRPGNNRGDSTMSWEQFVASGEPTLFEGDSMIIDIPAPFSASPSPARSTISLDTTDSPSLSTLPSPLGYTSISQILLPEVTPSPAKFAINPERPSPIDGGVVTMLRLQLASMENTAKDRLGQIHVLEQQLVSLKLARMREADELAGQVGALEEQMRSSFALRERTAEEQAAYTASLEEQLNRAAALREQAVQEAAKTAAEEAMQVHAAVVQSESQKWKTAYAARTAATGWDSVHHLAEGELDFPERIAVCHSGMNLLFYSNDDYDYELHDCNCTDERLCLLKPNPNLPTILIKLIHS